MDRVLDWLGLPSKWSSLKDLANGGGPDTYYGPNGQPTYPTNNTPQINIGSNEQKLHISNTGGQKNDQKENSFTNLKETFESLTAQYSRIINAAITINSIYPQISTQNAAKLVDHYLNPGSTSKNREDIHGAHMTSAFFNELIRRNRDLAAPLTSHPKMPGVQLAPYHFLKKDMAGNFTSSYSAKIALKTIFDDKECTLEDFTRRAYEAEINWRNANNTSLPRQFNSFDNSGVLWMCFSENDILTSAYPDYNGF